MQFKIVGKNTENYYLIGFDKEINKNDSVLLYKAPVTYFNFMKNFYSTLNVEEFVANHFDLMLEDDLLQVINCEMIL